MHDDNRRASDSLIIEMHGTLQRLDQRMDDTLRWVRESHDVQAGQIKDHETRLKPIEQFHETAKFLKWPALGVLAPTLTGIGVLIWDKMRDLLSGQH
jgi:hypothetical protein